MQNQPVLKKEDTVKLDSKTADLIQYHMTNNNLLGKATRSGFTGIELICDFQNLNAYGCSDSEDSDSSNKLPL